MSSEALLRWLSAYSQQEISEPVINYACQSIEKTYIEGSRGDTDFKTSELRRKYFNPLLEFGHVEYAVEGNPNKYFMIPPTLLELEEKGVLLLGARTDEFINKWQNVGHVYEEYSGHLLCWSKKNVDSIYKELNLPVQVHKINVNQFLKIFPKLKPNNIGIECDSIDLSEKECFNCNSGNWQKNVKIFPGVYRNSNLPPTAQPWYLVTKTTRGQLFTSQIITAEIAQAALSYCASAQSLIKLIYSKKNNKLIIRKPEKVFLPINLIRPITWLNSIGKKENNIDTYQNISIENVLEVSRILDVKLEEIHL